MSSSAQRKRRTTGSPLGSRPCTKTSRAANGRRTNTNRATKRTADGDPAPPQETIDVMDNTEGYVEEVVDLTCEGSEAAVVDLTSNDSVLVTSVNQPFNKSISQSTSQSLVDEGPQNRRVPTGRLPGQSAVPSVWIRTLRLLTAADWLFPLNVVMCSAVSV
ncbi:RING finger protein 4 isoform X4 [Scophthalmus maximus]|uniref:RING finger protein 4 isoform X4 n=1 Tax=Scophthalmus maximus TaxID=52904 RepID=UPI0015E14FB4|nr:RING finger protein 4 isoform X4 [Scophthalmus maximus]